MAKTQPNPLSAALFDPEGNWSDFITSAVHEAEKAMRKFPQPNYVITKVAEEAGEVVKAAVHCAEGRETSVNVRAEMRQLVAMLYRLWIEGDQVHGLPPVSSVLQTQNAQPTKPTRTYEDGVRDALAQIGALETPMTEDRMIGHEDAYRAVETLIQGEKP